MSMYNSVYLIQVEHQTDRFIIERTGDVSWNALLHPKVKV